MNPGSSGNFNFDPYLANIPQLETLRLQNLKPFLRAANDKSLHQLGRDNDCLFNTSTSSITGKVAIDVAAPCHNMMCTLSMLPS